MSGTSIGGKKAAQKNKEKHGEDFYKKIGFKGGKASRTGGFFVNRELARTAGAKGGKISRRRPNAQNNQDTVSPEAEKQIRKELLQDDRHSKWGGINWLLRHFR